MAIDALTHTSAGGKNQQAFQLFLSHVPQGIWDSLTQTIKDAWALLFDDHLQDMGNLQIDPNNTAASDAQIDGWVSDELGKISLVGIPARAVWATIPWATKRTLFDAVYFVINVLGNVIKSFVLLTAGGGAVVAAGVIGIGGALLLLAFFL